MFYGGDYNPEQWPEAVWREDVTLMRAAGVTLVTVGVFAWSVLEPEPGRYAFGWLDTVLDGLAGAGIRVALATPTAAPPPWFSRRHPETLPVGPDGVRRSHGSRDTYCASAPAYRAAARRLAGALADRYRRHPALALWRVHNEYGTTCHCDLTAGAFRRWLERRYGSLDVLNDAWTTTFWSQRYSDWAEVLPPRTTQYLANPAQVLDFRRFTSDELLDAYREQRDVLRTVAPGVPVTTNFVLGDWVPVDHLRWSREVDLVAVDHYPAESGPAAEEEAAFLADLARGWALDGTGRPDWLLMETAPNLIYTRGRMHAKEPGRMTRHALAAVARGSRGAMFFQWRAPLGGAEVFHSAVVTHAGADTRVYREAAALGAALARTTEMLTAAVEARAAVGFHEPSQWALAATVLPTSAVDHRTEARRAHRALARAGLTCDVVGALDGLSRYSVLVLPCWYLLTDKQAATLAGWVTGGGQLVATYLTGVADDQARVRTGGYPGALRDLLGVRVEEVHPLAEDARRALSGGASGSVWSEIVHLAGADATIRYEDGLPAVTRHRVGSGEAWYLSTRLDDDTYVTLLAAIAERAGVTPLRLRPPAGVEVVRRTADGQSWLVAINHGERPYDLRADGLDLLTGEPVMATDPLRPGAAMVVREGGG